MRFTAALLLPALVSAHGHAKHDAVRRAEIERLNALPGMTWTAGISDRFRGQPLNASKSLCGVKPGNLERMKAAIRHGEIKVVDAKMLGATDIPTEFDSETNWPECAKVIGDIRDQSNCGCCWAFGAAEAASDRLCIATGGKVAVPLSSQEMCFCAESDGCGGGFLSLAWSYIGRTGLVTGGQYKGQGPFGTDSGFCSSFSLPHCHHHGPQGSDPYPAEGAPGCPSESSPACPTQCDSGAKSPYNDFQKSRYTFTGGQETYENAEALQAAIMAHGPVETAFTVYSDFENYVSGIYQKTSSSVLGGHAVRIVGWGEENGVKYWKVANSWNPYWGEKGYFRIIRGQDECGIESQAMASSASAKWSGPGVNDKQDVAVTAALDQEFLQDYLNATTHYGDPKQGCESDEKAVQIQGISGDFCTPPCSSASACPTDVPEGVTAKPQCALDDGQGDKYCALICQPSSKNDDQCGANASCKAISGVGICTYDD